jgi:hypothetical protein
VRVEKTLWQRPGAPQVAGTFDMLVYGWLETDGARRFATTEGGVRLMVGHRYLTPLVRSDEGDWTVLSSDAPVTLAGGLATSRTDAGHPTSALQSLRGRNVESAGDLVRRTPQDPLAQKHSKLPPEARWQRSSPNTRRVTASARGRSRRQSTKTAKPIWSILYRSFSSRRSTSSISPATARPDSTSALPMSTTTRAVSPLVVVSLERTRADRAFNASSFGPASGRSASSSCSH